MSILISLCGITKVILSYIIDRTVYCYNLHAINLRIKYLSSEIPDDGLVSQTKLPDRHCWLFVYRECVIRASPRREKREGRNIGLIMGKSPLCLQVTKIATGDKLSSFLKFTTRSPAQASRSLLRKQYQFKTCKVLVKTQCAINLDLNINLVHSGFWLKIIITSFKMRGKKI